MLPLYPNLTPINLDLREQMQNIILESKTDASAFAFANLYLFRKKYNFNVSLLENSLLITGEEKGGTFFSILGNLPQKEVLTELLKKYDYWKSISEEQAVKLNALLPSETVSEDRNNFEYLYLRTPSGIAWQNFAKKEKFGKCFYKKLSAGRTRDKNFR